jgi:hypothetical protein
MADEVKLKSEPADDTIQFGEHVPKMMNVVGSDLQKGQPIASMQPIAVPPTPTQDSNSTSTNSANTNTEKKE